MPNSKGTLDKIAELTFVLDYCSCCHMIHILGHRKLFRSRRHIPEVTETKCSQNQSDEMKLFFTLIITVNILTLKRC